VKPIALLLFAAALLLHVRPSLATPGEVPVGQLLREATMQGLDGPSRPLSFYRGRPLIINVWASWCGPCRAEMASLERLAWSGAAQPFTLIGISTDDHPEAARAWLKRSNATVSHYIDRALELENMLGASRLPLTLLVDAQGRVLEKVYGAREWDSAASVALITRTFSKAAPPGKPKPPAALRSASSPP
jgi:thiol-disulfide isomerase/thioredoxin